MQKLEIPISKGKIALSIGGALLFVLAGGWLFAGGASDQSRLPPLMLQAVGALGVLFFGAIAIIALRRLFEEPLALVIDERGITDRTNATSVGLIEWRDIDRVVVEQVMTTRFLLIYVDNPEHYVAKAGGLKRRLLAANWKRYGTPLSITAATIAYDLDKLRQIIDSNLKTFRSQTVRS